MKLLSALFPLIMILSAAAPAVSAEPAPFEVNLGKAPPPPPKVDPAKVRAVERFFAARQSASLDGARKAEARRMLSAAAEVDESTLVGAKGHRLVAFDFHDAAIEPEGAGRFAVSVYLLFADREGRVTESRDERLRFSGERGAFVCTSLKPTNVMIWDSADIERSADSLQARDALGRAEEFLHAWAQRQQQASAYSIEDIYRADAGKLLIPCLRFTAELGKRGYEVIDLPLVASKGPGGIRVESSSN